MAFLLRTSALVIPGVAVLSLIGFVSPAGGMAKRPSIDEAAAGITGRAIAAHVRTIASDDYHGVDVRGKVVVLLRGDPGTATGKPDVFRGRNATVHSVLSEKMKLAASHGAVGVIIIHDDSAGYPWSVMSGGGFGSSQYFL